MIGGGKAGNIMSPNPNAIAASDSFKTPLTSVMAAGIIPAIAGLIVTCIISKKLAHKGSNITQDEIQATSEEKPNFLPAIAGPLAAIIMLSLRPLFNISIDPLVALPVGV